VGREIAKGILKNASGAPSSGSDGGTLIALSGDTGKTVVFAFPSDEPARRELRDQLRRAKTAQRRETFTRILGGTLEHLAYVSLLADSATRARLGVKLGTDSLPRELPNDPILQDSGIETAQEWQADVFPNGALEVPESDQKSWGLFLAWAKYANRQLASTANELRDTMHRSFQDQILGSS
jgi:hypothetical protein